MEDPIIDLREERDALKAKLEAAIEYLGLMEQSKELTAPERHLLDVVLSYLRD